jgi:hypothetical protein
MTRSIDERHLSAELFNALEEVCETHHGIFLDAGTSLAAQVAYITFHLQVIQACLLPRKEQSVDWGDIWRRVEAVNRVAWVQIRSDPAPVPQRPAMIARKAASCSHAPT